MLVIHFCFLMTVPDRYPSYDLGSTVIYWGKMDENSYFLLILVTVSYITFISLTRLWIVIQL